ncbi:tetraacyldisaccharide 4'-kinase [Alishewanella longhuensis]|uniref:Tetraacyldisaccharide 4'-kinase n=1 Tax=Alishewanella longhuensis TaxID=1091037 RepID=A0ABQ3KX97_9ALTE|nr:tetraacyldisaccharide 4'-kinase [Alishewanella longhuensis]GHG66953.1 tetraacyldisaccharide 4'-kinase [Alishewanella longhuensis]
MTVLERGWYEKRWWCYLLAPFSVLFWLLATVRLSLFRFKLKASYRLPVPVVVVGNISVGGTGKTPFTLWFCQFLRQQGFTPGIISRGYGVKIAAPVLVSAQHSALEVGDEPLLLAERSGCPVVVSPNRVEAARYLLQQCPQVNLIISDDGLQHYALQRDIEIVLIDGQRGLGNGWLLPTGPLRELPARLKHVDLVIANSGQHELADGVMTVQAERLVPLTLPEQRLPEGATVDIIAGIGNPQRFERSVLAAGYQIKQRRFLADHHPFSQADFNGLTTPLLMTEKDAVKCRSFAQAGWYYLAVQAQPESALISKLTEKLNLLRSQYGY